MLPVINAKKDSIVPLSAFGGLNLNEVIADGEWSDTKNMTNDLYPIFSNRKKRGFVSTLTKPQGMIGGKYLAYVDDNKLFYDEAYICDLEETNAERQLVMIGAYLCVFPDGKIYNTYTDEVDEIVNETEATGVTISLCKMDGTKYTSSNTIVGTTEPSDKTKYWLDTSSDPVVIKMYSASSAMWVSVGTTYVIFEQTGIGVGFHPYDAVTFSGVDKGSWIYNDYDFNQSNIVYDCGDDYLIVAGFINLNHTNSKKITFKRELPEMDFVCEKDNRIWGCSSDKHEIYACKQGDPKNWNFYGGLVSDSYAVTVGTQNVFTGCASFGGYVFFFKEDGYHKIYGTRPSNYEVQWKPGVGVQQGSSKSIAVVSDFLMIKARDGFYLYDGSMNFVSTNLGSEPFYEAVGGAYRNKYYVSMRDADYNYKFYVYDIKKKMWLIEDAMNVKYLAYAINGLYLLNAETNELTVINQEMIYKKIFPGDPSLDEMYLYPNADFFPGNIISGDFEKDFEWSFTTGDIDAGSPYHKYLKRIILRLWLDTNAKLQIEVMYDSSDEWINVMEYYCTRKRSYEIPIPVQRCDHFRIRFSGFGDMKLFSIAKAIEGGSAV